jgi:hypothetical protein
MKPIFSPAVFNSMQDLIDAGLIKKGGGVVVWVDGKGHYARIPPPEAFAAHGYKAKNAKGEELPFEAPPWGHTADAHSQMSEEEGGTSHGHRGVGHLIDGMWEKGEFGEHLKRDATGGFHMHGVDAVIHGIGNLIKKAKNDYPELQPTGDKNKDNLINELLSPKRIIQDGFEKWNEENPSNLHPDVDSPELRQLVISSFDKNNNNLRSLNGDKHITLHTNANGVKGPTGVTVESAAFKPFKHVKKSLTDTLSNFVSPEGVSKIIGESRLNFLEMPYVYSDHMTFGVNPATGEVFSRAKHTNKGGITGNNFQLNDSHTQHFGPAGFKSDAAFKNNSAASLIAGGLLHPEYYKEKPNRKGIAGYSAESRDQLGSRNQHGDFRPGNLHGNLFQMINRILPKEHSAMEDDRHHESNIPYDAIDMDDPMLDELIWFNDTPEVKYDSLQQKNVYGKPKNTRHTLREALESWKDARNSGQVQHSLANDFVHVMGQLMGFETLAGNNSRNNKREGGSQHLRIDDAIEELVGPNGRKGAEHLTTQDLINHSTGFGEIIGTRAQKEGGKAKGMGTHGTAARRYAHVLAYPELLGKEIPEDIREKYKLQGVVTPYTESKGNILNYLARKITASKGLEPAQIITTEKLQEIEPHTNTQMDNLIPLKLGVPDYAQHAIHDQGLDSNPTQNINNRNSIDPTGIKVDSNTGLPPVGTEGLIKPAGGPAGPAGPAALKPNITNGKVQVDYGPTQRQPAVGTQGLPSLSPSALQMRQSLMNQPQRGGFGNFMDKIRGRESPQAQADARLRGLMEEDGTKITPESMGQFREALSPVERDGREYQQAMLSDYPVQTSADKLIDMMERLQLTDAFADERVLKHVPNNKLNGSSSIDVNLMANNLNITSNDVRTILHSKGDWERIHKKYGYSDTIVKAVKVSFSGGLK